MTTLSPHSVVQAQLDAYKLMRPARHAAGRTGLPARFACPAKIASAVYHSHALFP